MRPAEPTPSLSQALALGLLQGPTELLPVSSSAHTTLVPWLAGSGYARLPPGPRKSLEVALHGGAALALAARAGPAAAHAVRRGGGRGALTLLLATAPPALAGLALRGTIERRLSGPGPMAAGLIAGSAAMALADRRGGRRGAGQAGPLDGLALGVAQALALAPGVSRNGATLAAARARGFDRGAAAELSWQVALPVLLGASALEVSRAALAPPAAREQAVLAAGAVAAFCSTALATRLLRAPARPGPLLPWSLYRGALAAAVILRLRRAQ